MVARIPPLVVRAEHQSLGNILSQVRDYTTRTAHICGLSQRATYSLKLAVDEIATNIIEHGYSDYSSDAIITLTTTITSTSVSITVEDNGKPYNPTHAQHEPELDTPLDTRELGGLGIHLALTSVDDFHYEFVAGCNRNTFTMQRKETPQKRAIHLLVAESDPAIRATLQHDLTVVGFYVDTHHDRDSILQLLLRQPYDLLVFGASMPQEDVMWLLKQTVLALDSDVPLILIIGDQTDFILRCLDLGASDYFHSSADNQLLIRHIQKLLTVAPEMVHNRISKLAQHIKNILLSDEAELRFGRDMNFERYLENFLIEIQAMYNADAGTLYLRTENDLLRFELIRTESLNLRLGGMTGHEVDFPTLPLYDRETKLPNHHNVATHVVLTGKTINIPDIYASSEFDFSGTRWFDERNNYHSISTLTVPLKDNNNYVIGAVQLINAQDDFGRIIPFETTQQMLVEALSAHTAVIVSNRRLLQRQEQLTKIEADLKIGRQIQRDFMPKMIPSFVGWQIGARFFPARDVAGDFYDLFEMNGNLVMIIADVCDKGVGAALFMALTRSLLRAFISQATESILALPPEQRDESAIALRLQQVINNTNDYILKHHYDLSMFTTLVVAVLLPHNGRLLYINGGHTPPPLLKRRNGTIEQLRPTGPAVGMFEDAQFVVSMNIIHPGDSLIAFTDGLIDAQNASNDTLSLDEIIHVIHSHEDTSESLINQLEDKLFNHIGDAPQFDDTTFWIINREIVT